jgi:hypothetical protein
VTTDVSGTLTFDTASGATYFCVSPGAVAPSSIPAVTGDPDV